MRRQVYLSQLDDGRWGVAMVEFKFDIGEGREIGEVVDFEIWDKMPELSREDIIYKKPAS